MSTSKEGRQPPLVVCVDVGDVYTVSKALLMSIVARSVRCAGFGEFRPSCICCVSVVRSVIAECLALKPCWVVERGISWVLWFRSSPSKILRGLQRTDIGLYEDGSARDFDGFRIGTMLPSFQKLRMGFCLFDRWSRATQTPLATLSATSKTSPSLFRVIIWSNLVINLFITYLYYALVTKYLESKVFLLDTFLTPFN